MKQFAAAIFLSVFMSSFFAGRAIADERHTYQSSQDSEAINELIQNRFAPWVKSATLTPPEPVADEEVAIAVEVAADPKAPGDDVSEVFVHYSADGGAEWSRIDLDNEKANVWTGTFPALPSGASVLYGIGINSYSGNAYIETVCKKEKAMLEAEESGGCAEAECVEHQPRGCMFPLSTAEGLKGAAPPDNMDLIDSRAGFNDDEIFIEYTFKGPLAGQTALSQKQGLFYMNGFIAHDRPDCGTGADALLCRGGILGYLPQGALKCSLDTLKGNVIANNASDASCIVKDNRLLFSIRRSALGDNLEDLSVAGLFIMVDDVYQARQYNIVTDYEAETKTTRQVYSPICTEHTVDMNGTPLTLKSCNFATKDIEETKTTKESETSQYGIFGKLFSTNYFTRIRFISRNYSVQ